ncbi:MAG: hypothetical protein ACO3MF_03520 [Acholeplasmataceae bacterium]
MNEERIYHEYASWKLEKIELIEQLKGQSSNLIVRFNHVMDVVDFLYDRMVETLQYNEEEVNIFKTGFYYIAQQIDEIETLLKDHYQDDLHALELRSKEVNLLLSTIDFQNELMGVEVFEQKDLDQLMDFEHDVLDKLKQKQEIPESMFQALDSLTLDIFSRLNVEFYSINDIFLEIADELGIIE